jgi:hypothetical protein
MRGSSPEVEPKGIYMYGRKGIGEEELEIGK